MAQTINTNVSSLNAQRSLNRSNSMMSTAIQRLSSGMRINSAKDDAAGMAISTRMTTQIGGLSVAMKNANDGISIAQTAEGAMDEMSNILNRMHDLSVQGASYNNTNDRDSMNQEVTQLKDELSRITSQTRYNGQKLLSGGFSANIQVGAKIGETISVDVSNLSPTGMGVASNYSDVSSLGSAALADRMRNQFQGAVAAADTINGVAVGSTIATNTNSIAKIDAINSQSSASGVNAFGYGNAAISSLDVTDANVATATGAVVATGELSINGISIDGATGLTDLVANINAKSGQHGITAAIDTGAAADQNRLVLYNTSGSAVEVNVNGANAAAVTGFAAGTTAVDAGANGLMVLNQDLNSTAVNFSTGIASEAMTGVANILATPVTYSLTNASVSSMTVNSAAESSLAMLAYEKAIDHVNTDRSVLGAKLNRFESLIRNLDNVKENISAARSRIQDTDFAVETANMSKAKILQQAGMAMVSQANKAPQSVMSLLR